MKVLSCLRRKKKAPQWHGPRTMTRWNFWLPRSPNRAICSWFIVLSNKLWIWGLWESVSYEDPREHGPKVVDLLQNMEFPKLDGDPRIDNIINKCWHNKYATVGKLLRVRRRCSLKKLRPIVRAVIMWIKTKILWRKISLPKGHSARNWWSADFSTCSPRESLSNLDVLWIGIDILLSRVDWTRFRGLRLGGEDGGSGKMFVSSKGGLGLENNVNNG